MSKFSILKCSQFDPILLLIYISTICLLEACANLNDGPEDLGGGYVLFNRCIYGDPDRPSIDITGRVEDYNKDSRFIIVKARPSNTRYADFPERMEFEYPLGRDTTYYWIIDKDSYSYYGPLDQDRYIFLKDSLGIELKFYNIFRAWPFQEYFTSDELTLSHKNHK